MASDPAFLSARALAGMVRKRRIGCVELLDHFIDRVERLDGKLNAVVVRDFERARARARQLDRAKAPVGRLHGVPMTVKESYDIAGLPTTWGVPGKNEIATRDALVVERLKAEGVVVFGKTNVPIMLGDWQSYNEVYGSTGNPWDLARSPGGSSGGGAAALAAGLTGLEIGSDIGGSIRQPAHACGVFGHKPTWGLMPPFGHSYMPGVAAMTDISVIGPLARSADDLAITLGMMARPDEAETGMAYDLPAPRVKTLKDLRVAIWAEDAATRTGAETSEAFLPLAKHLKREGAKVSMTARPDFNAADAFEVYLKLLSAALSGRAAKDVLARMAARAAKSDPADRSAHVVMDRAGGMSHGEWLAVNERRHKMRRAYGAFFKEWDVLLCPVLALPAIPRMEDTQPNERRVDIDGVEVSWEDMLFWPGLVGAFHLPATAAPLALSRDGLPIGVQIVGPMYGDRTTIAVAQMLEKSWRGFEAPEGWA